MTKDAMSKVATKCIILLRPHRLQYYRYIAVRRYGGKLKVDPGHFKYQNMKAYVGVEVQLH